MVKFGEQFSAIVRKSQKRIVSALKSVGVPITNSPVKLASNFRERILAHKRVLRKERLAAPVDKYNIILGEYESWDNSFKRGGAGDDLQSSPEKLILRGVERRIYDGVKERLKFKYPVVIVDFGGMYGLSFMKIANVLEEEGLISNGMVKVVITNLNFDPNLHSVDIGVERRTFFEANKHLVHFVNADARELYKMKVDTLGGTLGLRGKLDYIHEDFALSHGNLNDVDWYLLGKMLSQGGELISGSADPKYMHANLAGNGIDYRLRQRAHRLGLRNLARLGLRVVGMSKSGLHHYRIYKKS